MEGLLSNMCRDSPREFVPCLYIMDLTQYMNKQAAGHHLREVSVKSAI